MNVEKGSFREMFLVVLIASIIVTSVFGSLYYFCIIKPAQQVIKDKESPKNYLELKKDTVIKKGVKGGEGIKKYSWVLKEGTRIYFALEK